MGHDLPGFLMVAVLLAVTPGADTMLVLGRALRRGRSDAFRASYGVVAGLTVWATASAVGLAALLTASNTLYAVLRWAGAGYLIWLGVAQIARAGRSVPADSQEAIVTGKPFVAGLTTNLLNPKVGVFYLSFLPQLTPDGSGIGPATIGVAVVHIVMSWCWLAGLAAAGGRAADRLRPTVRRRLEALSGGLLVAFGARLALARR